MIRWKQAVEHFTDWGLTFGNPDFVKYAEAYGAKGSRVEATEDLVPTLEAAFAGGGVHLVTVPIDYCGEHAGAGRRAEEPRAGGGVGQGATVRMTEIEVRAPYDGQLIGTVAASGAEDVEAALATAYGCSATATGWLAPAERIEILRETARLMQRRRRTRARGRARRRQAAGRFAGRGRARDRWRAALRRAAAFGSRPGRTDGPERRLGGRVAFTAEPIGVVVAVERLQPPAEPDRASGGAGHRRRLPGDRQAGHRRRRCPACASSRSCARPGCPRLVPSAA